MTDTGSPVGFDFQGSGGSRARKLERVCISAHFAPLCDFAPAHNSMSTPINNEIYELMIDKRCAMMTCQHLVFIGLFVIQQYN
jgi:hypothetical protein